MSYPARTRWVSHSPDVSITLNLRAISSADFFIDVMPDNPLSDLEHRTTSKSSHSTWVISRSPAYFGITSNRISLVSCGSNLRFCGAVKYDLSPPSDLHTA